MNYTKEQLVDALVHEWEYLCHDDYQPEDPTPEAKKNQHTKNKKKKNKKKKNKQQLILNS